MAERFLKFYPSTSKKKERLLVLNPKDMRNYLEKASVKYDNVIVSHLDADGCAFKTYLGINGTYEKPDNIVFLGCYVSYSDDREV